MSVGHPYRSLIDQLYLPLFYEKGEEAVKTFLGMDIARRAFMAAYRDIPPIEELPEDEKKELKQYVTANFPKKSIEERLEACKIIYTIGIISN